MRHSFLRHRRFHLLSSLTGVLGGAFTSEGLVSVTIPVHIVVGEADAIAPPPCNARRFANLILTATLITLAGYVGHYAVLAEATELGKRTAPDICVDHGSVNRAAAHKVVATMAREFFDTHPSA